MDPNLVSHTRSRFALPDTDSVQVLPIEKGGSDRKFYRIGLAERQSVILLKYAPDRIENVQYARLAVFLDDLGVRVPHIYFHDESEGLIWMEDLGDRDLWSYQSESWEVRRALYESALDEIHILHRDGMARIACERLGIEKEFDAALYRWEQNYFFDNCLGRVFRLPEQEIERWRSRPALQNIADELDALPRVLVHRDFQSQNIIVRNGAAALIDFQGLRPGLAEYDLASLLYDPYVDLAEDERGALMGYYREGVGPEDRDFLRTVRLCAVQRLMQALGAYGHLGLIRGKSAFLEHVPRAMASLSAVAAEIPGLRDFSLFLAETASRP